MSGIEAGGSKVETWPPGRIRDGFAELSASLRKTKIIKIPTKISFEVESMF